MLTSTILCVLQAPARVPMLPASAFLRAYAPHVARPLLGVDYGPAKTGVALFVPQLRAVQELTTLKRNPHLVDGV